MIQIAYVPSRDTYPYCFDFDVTVAAVVDVIVDSRTHQNLLQLRTPLRIRIANAVVVVAASNLVVDELDDQ